MKRTLTLTSLLLSFAVFAQDDCNNPMNVVAGNYFVPVVNGTDAPDPICQPNIGLANHAEWYVYSATQDVSLTVSTDLMVNTGRDTRFHIYTGTCGNFVCVGGDDDSGNGLLSTTTIFAQQGTDYIIAFDDHWESNGFEFEISETPPGQNPVSFVTSPISLTGSAYCIVDMDGDHLDDVVAVNSTNINMHFQQPNGSFMTTNVITSQADHPASWSLCAGDLDGNGFTDLCYAGGGGATFMMANATGTAFTEISPSIYIFCQRSNMVDINVDGDLDVFVCHDVDPNVYFINDGTGNFTSYQGGMGDTPDGGNYGSIWSDIDGDGDNDMFISKCRGGTSPANINQLHLNDGAGNFTEAAAAYNLADNVQTWSSSVGDFDNDGDMDIVVGASSTSNGSHKVMRNDGSTFTDVTAGSGMDMHNGVSIEWTTHDFDNDGNLDILGGGALMLGNGDLTFTHSTVTPNNGPIGDLNNDGFLDIQNGSTLYMNTGNNNNYIKVYTVGTVSNRSGIGARVEVVTPSGTKIRDIKSGDGFRYMSSMAAHFGLGSETQVDRINVYWPSGIVQTVFSPNINEGIEIVEAVTTDVDDVVLSPEFLVYPNPATDELNLSADGPLVGSSFEIFDVAGKLVLSGAVTTARLGIGELRPGSYLLRVQDKQSGSMQQQFVKN